MATTDPKTEKPLWTIMLYLSGDNDLGSMMVRTIDDVGQTSLTAKSGAVITIQYDPVSPDFKPSVFDLTQKRTDAAPGSMPHEWALVKGFKVDENSAAPKTLSDFIVWSATTHESTYRMLVLSGHGSGAVGDFLPDNDTRSAASARTDRAKQQPQAMTIPELQSALKEARTKLVMGRKLGPDEELLHILGMDSCLMGMAEVAYRVQDYAQYLVASEGFTPSYGWPYRHLWDCLEARVARGEPLDPLAISGCIVEDYLGYYAGQRSANVSVDISSCDLTRLRGVKRGSEPGLRSTMGHLTDTLCRHLDQEDNSFKGKEPGRLVADLLVLAHWRAQSFKYEQYTDLWDFCMELKYACDRHGGFPEIASACEGVAKSVVALVGGGAKTNDGRQGFRGVNYQHAHGLSVYFPWSDPGAKALENYEKLEAGEDGSKTGWARFLRLYVDKTRREPRDGPQVGHRVTAERTWTPGQRTGVRDSPGYNRDSPGYNRALLLLGETLPWSMKNPPIEDPVEIRPLSHSATRHPKPSPKGRPHHRRTR